MIDVGEGEVEKIIQEILKARPQLTREKIEKMINDKVKEFGDIIRRDAAALMLAKELGVTLSRESAPASLTTLKIKDLASGFRGVDVEGVIVYNSGLRVSTNGRKFLRYAIADETGIIWGILWEDDAEKLYETLQVGSKVRLSKVAIRKYRDRNEVFLEKNSSVKLLSSLELRSLLEFLGKYDPGTQIVRAIRTVSTEKENCVLGVDSKCNIVLVQTPLEIHPVEGSIITLSGCREYVSRNVKVIRCDSSSIRVLEGFPRVEEVFSCPEKTSNMFFGFNAEILGYVLFNREGGRIFLKTLKEGGDGEISSITVSHDAELLHFSKSLGKICEITGAQPVEDYFRETPCLNTRVIGDSSPRPKYTFSKFIGSQAAILNRATILSWNTSLRCLDEKPLFHISILLDDGVSTLRGLCNNPRVFEKIFLISMSEVCEYPPSALQSIISFLSREIQGREAIVKARLMPTHYQYSLIIDDLDLLP